MGDIRRNTTDWEFEVSTDITGTPTFTAVEGVTGFSVEDNSTYRSVRALGDGKWQKMLAETRGITFGLQLDHLMDAADDSLEPGQAILANATWGVAGETVGAAASNLISVNFTHPSGTLETTGVFSVHDGSLGLGSGGSDGSFNTAQYRLVSHGAVSTS